MGTVDMGADEFYYHLYHIGDVVPGGPPAVPGQVPIGLMIAGVE